MKSILRIVLLAALTGSATMASAQRLVPPGEIPSVTRLAQSVDSFRVNELEEQVRQLNGKVEELNFLLLQLQEKIRFTDLNDLQLLQKDPLDKDAFRFAATSVLPYQNGYLFFLPAYKHKLWFYQPETNEWNAFETPAYPGSLYAVFRDQQENTILNTLIL